MVRIFHAYFPKRTLMLAFSEALLIVLGLLAATTLRLQTEGDAAAVASPGFTKILLAATVCIFCMHYYDLYDSSLLRSLPEELVRLTQGLGTTCIVLAVLYYAFPPLQLGRGILVTGILLVGSVLVVTRKTFVALNRLPRLAERIVILGDGPLAGSLATEIERRPELGMRLLGYVSDAPDSASMPLPRLGANRDLTEIVPRARADRILVALSERRGSLPMEGLLQLKRHGAFIQDGIDLYEKITGKVPIDSLRPSWLVFSPGFRISRKALVLKRVFSVALSAFGLVLGLPLMAPIALAIWLDSGGPVIFRQSRVGQGGKLFTLYKFRTMRNGADPEGACKPAELRDKRFTRVGRWLRRTRLDELPQLVNILLGDMYFVGPRPFVANQEEELARQIPLYRQRWTIRPGATGWAQIHRGYCQTLEDNIEKLAYDLYYLKNMSLGLDILIVFQTIKILILGRGAR